MRIFHDRIGANEEDPWKNAKLENISGRIFQVITRQLHQSSTTFYRPTHPRNSSELIVVRHFGSARFEVSGPKNKPVLRKYPAKLKGKGFSETPVPTTGIDLDLYGRFGPPKWRHVATEKLTEKPKPAAPFKSMPPPRKGLSQNEFGSGTRWIGPIRRVRVPGGVIDVRSCYLRDGTQQATVQFTETQNVPELRAFLPDYDGKPVVVNITGKKLSASQKPDPEILPQLDVTLFDPETGENIARIQNCTARSRFQCERVQKDWVKAWKLVAAKTYYNQ